MRLLRTLGVAVVGAGILWSSDARAQTRNAGTEAQTLVEEADALVRGGSLAEGAEKYKRAIAVSPSMAEAYTGYLRVLFIQKEYRRGEKVGREALQRNPSATIKAGLGMHLYKLDRHKEAHQYLKEAAPDLPGSFDVQLIAGQCCAAVKDHACAAAAFKNYLAARPQSAASKDFLIQTDAANALLEQDQTAEAERLVQLALRAQPTHGRGQVVLGRIALKQGKCDLAVAKLSQFTDAAGTDAQRQLWLGQSYLCVRRYRDAMKSAGSFLAAYPDQPEGLLLRGDAAFGLKQLTVALADYKKLVSLTGGGEQVTRRIAEIYFSEKRYPQVLAEIEREVSKRKPRPEILILCVRAAIRAKSKDRATECAEKLLEQAASAEAFYFVGVARSSAGTFAEAAALFERALDLDARHAGARTEYVRVQSRLARRHYAEAEYEEATKLLEKALRRDPSSVVAGRNLALVQLTHGAPQKALHQIEKVLQRVPRDFVANRLAGRALFLLGKYAQAQTYFDRVLPAMQQIGGEPLVLALAESGANRVRLGMGERGVKDLERSLEVAGRTKISAQVVKEIRRSLARALFLKGQELLSQGQAKEAWTTLERMSKIGAELSATEKVIVGGVSAVCALAAGEVAAGKRLLKQLRGKLDQVFLPAYEKIGRKLLDVYAEYLGPSPAAKQAAAVQLEQLAKRLPKEEATKLLALARSGYEQAMVLWFKQGRLGDAKAAHGRAQALAKSQSPRQRHDGAVMKYAAGQKQEALDALEAVKAQVPLALCNLAVHTERAGDARKAAELYRQCLKRGATFPGLHAIVEARARLFEGRQP